MTLQRREALHWPFAFFEIIPRRQNKHDVEYLIIGAYAVMYHTRVARGTKDMDLWIRHSKENSKKCALAIKDFAGIDVKPDDFIGEKEIFFIGVEPHRIDIFNRQGRFPFDRLVKSKNKR